MQSKKGNRSFLRLVENDSEAIAQRPINADLLLEADKIEALNGSNPYSAFLRKHRRRPDRDQAAAIGRLLGGCVRASDGTMQPQLTTGEREAVRLIRKHRREWSQQMDHIHWTIAAITALAENHHEPICVLEYGSDAFSDPNISEKLDSALKWLKRFAQELCHHDSRNPRAEG